MQINKKITPYNHYNGRNGQGIQYIVIHYVGALGGAEANCTYYASGDVGASAHYYVGFSGEIWQSVEDCNGAWSVGGGRQGSGGGAFYGKANNYNTLNIEMCVRKRSTASMNANDQDWYYEDATVKATIELTKMLMQKYGIPLDRVIRHYDVNGKICPNPYVLDESAWQAFKKKLSGSAAVTGTKITGKATATAEQMQKYIRSKNPGVAQSVLDMVPQYIQEGKTEGIRGDIAFAQSCLETGNFTFKDSAVTLEQNNFCGMGVTANGMKGNSFTNTKTGIRAQIQHLKAYACTEPLKKECVDPRFQYVERGCAKYVEWLGIQENPKGKGWASGSGYGSKILNILEAITGTKEEQPKPTPTPQPEPDQAGTYKVQAGSYKDKKLANSLAAVLKNKGFDAIVKEEAGQYKVQCGAFSNKKNADMLVRQIKGSGFDAIVKGTDNSIWVGKCTGDGVNVRKGPGENYGNIAGYPKLNKGNLVDVINKESGWYQILIDKKYSGFVSAQYIEKA
ncbi:N-acetylmuramoyl-L-alanine amidase [uncultured Robinsoniella sp.]|uniref:N-acetylmuramoyl-L-alanine amidase n=1 Tax=uncultured Robinsoniella sp. TaxID=904190 RepID=UPI00374E441E